MEIRKRIQESAVRGKIDFAIWVEKDVATDAPQVNIPLAKSYYHKMQALAGEFESIYYVDTVTDEYREYTAQSLYESQPSRQGGKDFFRDQFAAGEVIYCDRSAVNRYTEKKYLKIIRLSVLVCSAFGDINVAVSLQVD